MWVRIKWTSFTLSLCGRPRGTQSPNDRHLLRVLRLSTDCINIGVSATVVQPQCSTRNIRKVDVCHGMTINSPAGKTAADMESEPAFSRNRVDEER